MKFLLPIFLLLAACSVQVQPTVVPQAVETLAPDERLATAESQSTRALATAFVPTPTPDRWNFLILGIDKAYWRDSDPKRPHTDFMMVVSIHDLGEVAEVTLIQIPRNVYIPSGNIPDDFAFGMYSEGGLGMIEGWVEQSLELPLIGSVAMRMDDFITLVDDLGGLTVGGQHMDGLEVLTYTRFDLFERPGFDAEGKHFLVLSALADKMRGKFSDPESAFGLVLRYLPLVETDLDPGGMVDFLFTQGLPLVQGRYSIERVRLEDVLCYEDIPFENPGTSKGLLVCEGVNLHEWVQSELK